MKVYIKAAHSDFSPGAVFYGRREYDDVLKFGRLIKKYLEAKFGISAELYSGHEPEEMTEDDLLIVLHRGSNMKNSEKYGACVTVKSNASADIQYHAYRLLMGICGKRGFRYGGVHVFTEKNPHKSFERSKPQKAFLFMIGFIDSAKDNRIFDNEDSFLAYQLSFRISEIIKESENEDHG